MEKYIGQWSTDFQEMKGSLLTLENRLDSMFREALEEIKNNNQKLREGQSGTESFSDIFSDIRRDNAAVTMWVKTLFFVQCALVIVLLFAVVIIPKLI